MRVTNAGLTVMHWLWIKCLASQWLNWLHGASTNLNNHSTTIFHNLALEVIDWKIRNVIRYFWQHDTYSTLILLQNRMHFTGLTIIWKPILHFSRFISPRTKLAGRYLVVKRRSCRVWVKKRRIFCVSCDNFIQNYFIFLFYHTSSRSPFTCI